MSQSVAPVFHTPAIMTQPTHVENDIDTPALEHTSMCARVRVYAFA